MSVSVSLLDVITRISYNDDKTAKINVKYLGLDELPNTIVALIPDSAGKHLSIDANNGDLLIEMKFYPERINYKINDNGELIITTSTNDADKYFVDNEDGLLKYHYSAAGNISDEDIGYGIGFWIIEDDFVVS